MICYIKHLHPCVVTKPGKFLSSVMTVKNDGNFGSEPETDHRCFAKGELTNSSWKSIKTDSQKIKIKKIGWMGNTNLQML